MRFLLVLMCATVYSGVIAQNIIDLNPVSITTSRLPQQVSKTGRSISVIQGKDVAKLPVTSIDDLLKYVTGVEVQQRGIAGAQADLVIRGGTFQQVLVLIDGVKLNDPLTGHFSAYMPVDISQIDRIEIVRGSASAVYGSEAVGGVVHIITKAFTRRNEEKTTHGSFGVSGGEYGAFGVNASLHTTGRLNFSIAGTSTNATGYKLRSGNGAFFNNDVLSINASVKTSSNATLMLHSSFDNRHFAAENFYTTLKSDTAKERVETWWHHVKFRKENAHSSDEIDAVFKKTNDRYKFNPAVTANSNESKMFVLQYTHAQSVCSNARISYGVNFENIVLTSNDRGNHDNNRIAAFSAAELNFNKLTLTPGLRIDADERYNAQVLPQISASYALNKLTLRTMSGRSIRAADFTERFNNYNKRNLTGGSIGNPDLTAETAWSFEAGADYLQKNFKLSVTGFYRNQDNVIDWVATSYNAIPRKENILPNKVYAFARNIKEVKTSGIEGEFIYDKSFNKFGVRFTTGVAITHSTSNDSIPSFYIISHAHALIQQNILITAGNFSIGINALYKKRRGQKASAIEAEITPDYFLLNAKAMWKYKYASVFAEVNNITNEQYSDLLGSLMPPRWFIGGITVSF